MMERVESSMNSTRTWVTPPRDPVRPSTLTTLASLTCVLEDSCRSERTRVSLPIFVPIQLTRLVCALPLLHLAGPPPSAPERPVTAQLTMGSSSHRMCLLSCPLRAASLHPSLETQFAHEGFVTSMAGRREEGFRGAVWSGRVSLPCCARSSRGRGVGSPWAVAKWDETHRQGAEPFCPKPSSFTTTSYLSFFSPFRTLVAFEKLQFHKI